MSFVDTSCMTPRPNRGAGPVTRMSVSTLTLVPSLTSVIVEVIVAAAVPWPRASLAWARMATLRLASSASWIRTVPLYWAVIGPILIFIAPWYSPSSPPPSSTVAPGRQVATRGTSSRRFHASSIDAGTVNSLSSFTLWGLLLLRFQPVLADAGIDRQRRVEVAAGGDHLAGD